MKTGRNDPCPCGSGRKYKKCCLKHERQQARQRRDLTVRTARFNDTLEAIHLAFDHALGSDIEPAEAVCRRLDLHTDALYDGESDILFSAFALDPNPDPELEAAVDDALDRAGRQTWRAIRSSRLGLYRTQREGQSVRFEPHRAPSALPTVEATVMSGDIRRLAPGYAAGWVVPAHDAFIGMSVCSHGVERFDEGEYGTLDAWSDAALRVAADPHDEFSGYEDLSDGPANLDDLDLMGAAGKMILFKIYRRPDPIRVEGVWAISLFEALYRAPENELLHVVRQVIDEAYDATARPLGNLTGDPSAARAVLEDLVPPSELLEPLGLSPERGLLTWNPEAASSRPAALLCLPDDHPVWTQHAPDAPIRALRGWQGEGAGDVEVAIDAYLAEARFMAAVPFLFGREHDVYEEACQFLETTAPPGAASAPLAALDLDGNTRRRTAKALETLHGRTEADWRLHDLRPAELMIDQPGFAEGSLRTLGKALLEWIATWRAQAAGLEPAHGHVQLELALDDGEALDEGEDASG